MMKKHEPMTEEQLLAIKARAEAATPGPWGIEHVERRIWGGSERVCFLFGQDRRQNENNGVFIAHARQDIPDLLAEVERLRAEVARLKDEVASLEQELKFSGETECELIKKLFDLKICHKKWICEQDGSSELNFEGETGCHFCWRQWAIMKARKEVDEEGSHE